MSIIAEKKSDRLKCKKTRTYELVVLYRSNISSIEVQQDLTALFSFISARCFGVIHLREYWGLRPISYEILGNKKAHYYCIKLEMTPDLVRELSFRIKTNANIIRRLILKCSDDSNLSAPSSMMRNLPSDIEKEMGEIQLNESFIYKM